MKTITSAAITFFVILDMGWTTGVAQEESRVEDRDAIDEIIVTANRREENLMDVAMSVSVIDAQQLQDVSIEDIQRIADFTPGMVASGQRAEQGTLNIYIRGIGSNAGEDPAVGYYVDEIYTGSESAFNTQFIDVERVEVLKGPQGTLWGRNTTGGAINVVTKKPTDDFEATLYTEFAELNSQKYGAAVSGPLTDTLNGRVTVARVLQDYQVQNSLSDRDYRTQDAWSGRAHLQWQPTEELDLLLTLGYTDDASHNLFLLPSIVTPGSASEFFHDFFDIPPSGLFEVESELDNPKAEYEAIETRLDINYSINDKLGLRSLTGWNRNDQDRLIDLDGNFTELLITGTENRTKWWSEELQLIYSGDRWDFTTGLFYYRESSDRHFFQPGSLDLFAFANCSSDNFLLSSSFIAPLCGFLFPFYTVDVPAITNASFGRDPIPSDYYLGGVGAILGTLFALPPGTLINNLQVGSATESKSVYGQANWRFTDAWTLSVGLRYTEDERDRRMQQLGGSLTTLTALPEESGSASFDAVTPKLGLEWRPTDQSMYYLSYTAGYKSGGFGSIFRLTDTFTEEKVHAFEAGLKVTALDGRLQYQGSAFYYDYEDLQVSLQFPDAQRTTNIDGAKVAGAELGTIWHPADSLRLGLNLTYLDTEVTDFFGTNNVLDPFDLAGGSQDIIGNPLPVAPEWQGIAFANYSFALGDYGSLDLGGYVNSSDSYVHDPFGSFETPGYTLYNANVRWTSPNARYTVNLFGRNLTDKAYVPNSFFTDAFGILLFPAKPRVTGIQFVVDFQ